MADEKSRSWFAPAPPDKRMWRTVVSTLSAVVFIGPFMLGPLISGYSEWLPLWPLAAGLYLAVEAALLWTHRCASRTTQTFALLLAGVAAGLLVGWVLIPMPKEVLWPFLVLVVVALLANSLRGAANRAMREPPIVDPDVFS